jgi:DNA-binding IscR family transcriptional regulator
MRGDRLFSSASEEDRPDVNAPGAGWVVRDFEERVEAALAQQLDSTTLADLVRRKTCLNDSLSIMPGI